MSSFIPDALRDNTSNSQTPPRAIVFGVSSTTLTDGERQFFHYANPFGFILFQRNCAGPAQVKELVADLRRSVGRPDAPIFIDQEGGRVARLKPPHWPEFPPARIFGQIAERDLELGREATKINAQLIGLELAELGITVNCAPLADLLYKETDKAIGDRAFSADPEIVAECARACAEGLLWAGVLPVIKHLPGHGRTLVDPHHLQARVGASVAELAATDFVPFKALRDLPIGMTCHILFTAIDAKYPGSISPAVHDHIRQHIGFDGLLLSDDLNMKGILGRIEDLVENVILAGSDLALHCNGNMSEMVAAAAAAPRLSDEAKARWQRALAMRKTPPLFIDKAELFDRLDMLLGAATKMGTQ